MRTTIYLVRHGEVYNPDGIFYGRLKGFPLSDKGRTEVHALGKYLSDKKISAIYASPLERAQETASIIASYHSGLSVVADERLSEVLSCSQGRKLLTLVKDWYKFYNSYFTKLGGETMSDIWKRMQRVIADTVKMHKGKEIVLVSHGDPIRITIVKHKGRPLRVGEIRQEELVATAHGYRFTFDEFRAVDIAKLDF